MKKLISLVTAGMLAMSLAACGSSGSGSAAAGGSSASSEPTTVTVYCMSFNNIPEDSEVTRVENLMNDYLAKTYPDDNIAIDIKLFGPAEYTQKVQLAMQSGDKIDAFSERALANDVASDMLAPMNDLLEKYGQEVTAKLKEDFDENPYTATTINGTIYAVPANKGMALNGNLIWDDDIAQAAGVDMSTVNSIEDLEAVFEQVHAYDPNIVCYAPNNQGDTSLIRPILRSEEKIDCLNDTDYYAGVSMNGDSTVTNLYASDAFMEKCKLMREWNQKGYLQADAATTTSTAPELFSAGRCFSTIDAYGGDSAGAVLSLSSGHNLKSKILYNFYFDSASVYVDFGIASTSKVPEAAMKMINRLWTDEYLINTFLYKGYMTYDFFLPGLVLDAIENKDGSYLAAWADELRDHQIHTVNMLGCHDGIPLLDLKGMLPEERIQSLIGTIVARGGMVKDLHGQKNIYYQVNATYYSALGADDDKMLLARAIQLFMPGKPQVWYLDLFAGKNDVEAVRHAGAGGHKEINRTNLNAEQINTALQRDVVQRQLDLLRLRKTHPAFHSDAEITTMWSAPVLSICWKHGADMIVLRADLVKDKFEIQ